MKWHVPPGQPPTAPLGKTSTPYPSAPTWQARTLGTRTTERLMILSVNPFALDLAYW